MPNYTKQRFASTLISLMKTVPFERISVKCICKACNERRQTFYYHFKDKYDLVTWIYYQDAASTISENKNSSWIKTLEMIFTKMDLRRDFYRNAFSDNSQNALIFSILEHDILIYRETLTGGQPQTILDDDLMFSIKYHAFACVNITKQWLESNDPISPSELAYRIYQNMPETLKASLP